MGRSTAWKFWWVFILIILLGLPMEFYLETHMQLKRGDSYVLFGGFDYLFYLILVGSGVVFYFRSEFPKNGIIMLALLGALIVIFEMVADTITLNYIEATAGPSKYTLCFKKKNRTYMKRMSGGSVGFVGRAWS